MNKQTDIMQSIMEEFAISSGLVDSNITPRRYLWTDAFAVCNFLQLYKETETTRYLDLAVKLVDQVHEVLGKHHKDSDKSGWLSGLDDEQARLHPTIAGLRIGKPLRDRPAGEAYDEALEWDRDGQYFHYLTRWMHALNRVSQVTGNTQYIVWALELAKVAYRAFSYIVDPEKPEQKRMVWKMSCDLSYPVVPSMGQHDPLDGLLTFYELRASAQNQHVYTEHKDDLKLDTEIRELQLMCAGKQWVTQDTLGMGGLLGDAYKLMQLIATTDLQELDRLESLLKDIETSLLTLRGENPFTLPAEYRLAFRELGLAIGLKAIPEMKNTLEVYLDTFSDKNSDINTLTKGLEALVPFSNLASAITEFWLDDRHQSVSTWQDHQDINTVMLATSLSPQAYLKITD